MAILRIWNDQDQIILEDSADSIYTLEDLLDDYKAENKIYSSGGLGYDIKIHTNDDLLMMKDELEDESGDIIGRYEMKVY